MPRPSWKTWTPDTTKSPRVVEESESVLFQLLRYLYYTNLNMGIKSFVHCIFEPTYEVQTLCLKLKILYSFVALSYLHL